MRRKRTLPELDVSCFGLGVSIPAPIKFMIFSICIKTTNDSSHLPGISTASVTHNMIRSYINPKQQTATTSQCSLGPGVRQNKLGSWVQDCLFKQLAFYLSSFLEKKINAYTGCLF